MDELKTELALLVEMRTAHILAKALDLECWDTLIKVARAQAEEELEKEEHETV